MSTTCIFQLSVQCGGDLCATIVKNTEVFKVIGSLSRCGLLSYHPASRRKLRLFYMGVLRKVRSVNKKAPI